MMRSRKCAELFDVTERGAWTGFGNVGADASAGSSSDDATHLPEAGGGSLSPGSIPLRQDRDATVPVEAMQAVVRGGTGKKTTKNFRYI